MIQLKLKSATKFMTSFEPFASIAGKVKHINNIKILLKDAFRPSRLPPIQFLTVLMRHLPHGCYVNFMSFLSLITLFAIPLMLLLYSSSPDPLMILVLFFVFISGRKSTIATMIPTFLPTQGKDMVILWVLQSMWDTP